MQGVWTNGWNPNRLAYNWYDWFTNPFVGGETHAIKTFPTFYTLESRKGVGVDSNNPTGNHGILVCHIANSTWETGHGGGGFKHMTGNVGLSALAGRTSTWQDQNIGLVVTVLESGTFYDKVRVEYRAEPQRAASRQVFLGSLTASNSFVTAEEAFTVDFDIRSFGGPNTNDATSAPGVPTRVGTPVGVQPGLAGFEMVVDFDAENLEFVSAGNAPFNYIVNSSAAAYGRLFIAGAGDKSINRDTILSLNFRAKEGAAAGTYNVLGTINDVVLHNWRGDVIRVGDAGFNGTANGSAVGTIGNGGFGAFHSPNTLNLSSETIRSTGGVVTIGAEKTFVISGRVVCETHGPLPGTFTGVESAVRLYNAEGQFVAATRSCYKGYWSIDGVVAGEGYYITANKPHFALGTSAPFAVAADTKVTGLDPLTRQRFTVSGVVYGMEGSRGFINNNTADNSTTLWQVNPQAVPLAGVEVYLVNTGDAFAVVGGPVVTDEYGRYTIEGWQVGRDFVAVAVSVQGTEFEGIYQPQIIHPDPAFHQGHAGITERLELMIGSKYGDNNGNWNWPSGTGRIGRAVNTASGIPNLYCFRLNRNITNAHVVLTETTQVQIRLGANGRNTATVLQLFDMDDNPVGPPMNSLGRANGDDVIPNVPPGTYYITVSRPGHVPAASAPFSVVSTRAILRDGPDAGAGTMDVVTTVNGRTLSGTLVCAISGDPIEGVRVQHKPHSATQGASLPVRTSATGAFSVTTTNTVGDLEFSADGFVFLRSQRPAGNASGLVFELTPLHTVTFYDWDGSVLAVREVPHGSTAMAPFRDPVRENWTFAGWDVSFSEVTGQMVVTAVFNPMIVRLQPSAFVTKLNGNQNDLTITVTETWSDGLIRPVRVTLRIPNNAAATYTVGPYRVYVDTKGNDQIRACDLVNPPALPHLGIR
jgi:hypothetical protein